MTHSPDASFAENFYGLYRRRRTGINTQRATASVSTSKMQTIYALNRRQINLSLLFLIGIPYVEAKLSQYWTDLGGGLVEEGDDHLFGDGFDSGGNARTPSLIQVRSCLRP